MPWPEVGRGAGPEPRQPEHGGPSAWRAAFWPRGTSIHQSQIPPIVSGISPVARLDGGATSSWLALVPLEVGQLQEAGSVVALCVVGKCCPARIPARRSGEADPGFSGAPRWDGTPDAQDFFLLS